MTLARSWNTPKRSYSPGNLLVLIYGYLCSLVIKLYNFIFGRPSWKCLFCVEPSPKLFSVRPVIDSPDDQVLVSVWKCPDCETCFEERRDKNKSKFYLEPILPEDAHFYVPVSPITHNLGNQANSFSKVPNNGLCKQCNHYQEILIQLFLNYENDDSDSENDENSSRGNHYSSSTNATMFRPKRKPLQVYRQELEVKYPLCGACAEIVREKLKRLAFKMNCQRYLRKPVEHFGQTDKRIERFELKKWILSLVITLTFIFGGSLLFLLRERILMDFHFASGAKMLEALLKNCQVYYDASMDVFEKLDNNVDPRFVAWMRQTMTLFLAIILSIIGICAYQRKRLSKSPIITTNTIKSTKKPDFTLNTSLKESNQKEALMNTLKAWSLGNDSENASSSRPRYPSKSILPGVTIPPTPYNGVLKVGKPAPPMLDSDELGRSPVVRGLDIMLDDKLSLASSKRKNTLEQVNASIKAHNCLSVSYGRLFYKLVLIILRIMVSSQGDLDRASLISMVAVLYTASMLCPLSQNAVGRLETGLKGACLLRLGTLIAPLLNLDPIFKSIQFLNETIEYEHFPAMKMIRNQWDQLMLITDLHLLFFV